MLEKNELRYKVLARNARNAKDLYRKHKNEVEQK